MARVRVVAADRTQIEATVDRRDPSAVEVVLDPRRDGRYLALMFHWREGERTYGVSVWIEPLASPQVVLPFQGPDFAEAVDAAADWFDGTDYHGRDGTWAARTLRELAELRPK
ncbi:hypothetical protein DVA67_007835 [Solirubrobacter sp. CPCC 204708]|nr:hypothetical protein [Solirubrobacter deserti]